MKITLWSGRLLESARQIGAKIGAVAVFLLIIAVASNIIIRLFTRGIPGILDISQSLMVILVTMMLAYTQAHRGHIGVKFIFILLPERAQKVVELVTLLMSLAFVVLLSWQSWLVFWSAFKEGDHSAIYPYIPLSPAKLSIALGMSLLCIQLMIDIWQILRGIFLSPADGN